MRKILKPFLGVERPSKRRCKKLKKGDGKTRKSPLNYKGKAIEKQNPVF